MHDDDYNWTPELIRNVISNYGFPEESIGPHKTQFPQRDILYNGKK